MWFEMPDDFDSEALDTSSRVRSRSLESRTIIAGPDHVSLFDMLEHVPLPDRQRLYNVLLTGYRGLFLEGVRGYSIVDEHVDLIDVFYLPLIGVYGRPTAIINGSRSFAASYGDDIHCLALLNEVPYYDAATLDRSLPLGRHNA